MIGISAVEGASRELRGDSVGIKTGRALSEQAPSGPVRFRSGDFVALRSGLDLLFTRYYLLFVWD